MFRGKYGINLRVTTLKLSTRPKFRLKTLVNNFLKTIMLKKNWQVGQHTVLCCSRFEPEPVQKCSLDLVLLLWKTEHTDFEP